MGTSTSKLKKEKEGPKNAYRYSMKKLATPFIYTRKGSMYFDQDGDLAHEFYEEVPSFKKGIRTKMKRILEGLTPQGEVKLSFPCLHVDFPIIMMQDT